MKYLVDFYQELSDLPADAALLMRTEKEDLTSKVQRFLEENKIHYIAGIEAKNQVNFYISSDQRLTAQTQLKEYLYSQQP
ncbi:hypothetical protein HOC13_03600 [Candidatus Woesearchaeota archaeon]|jgi:hypothetical protein|nr:hypothetical protein [Candidatus Woesearchaeota archaeon]